MAQHDYVIDNQEGLAFRQDLNNVLKAIAENNMGATAPTTTYAGMWWLDISTNPLTLKMRNESNNGWRSFGSLPELELPKIKQGGGVGQTAANASTIKIGWSGSRLKATVDVTDLGNIVFDSTLNQAFAESVGVAKAWAKFSWNGSAISINKSFNISSVIRDSAGFYTIGFSQAFSDTNYVVVGTGTHSGEAAPLTITNEATPTVNGVQLRYKHYGLPTIDLVKGYIVVFNG